jgi:DNA primase
MTWIDEVKGIDIRTVIEPYVSLKKYGQSYKGLCPFHSDKRPSLSIKADKNTFKCFVCGQGGTGVDFVIKHDKLSFMDACKKIAAANNIIPPNNNYEDKNKDLYSIYETSCSYFEERLEHNKEIKEYVVSRFPMYKEWRIGYDDGRLINVLRGQSIDIEWAEKIGLIGSGCKYDFLFNRVTFPIMDINGRVISFGGRDLRPNPRAKYINTKNTPIYHKSTVLYGLDKAMPSITKLSACWVVEGYADVISMHSKGINNVVGKCGSFLNAKQINPLRGKCKTIGIIPDGDNGGKESIYADIMTILSMGFKALLVSLPSADGKQDPDSFFIDRKHFAEYYKEHSVKVNACLMGNKNGNDFKLYDIWE